MILGISGKIGSGKDTIGKIIQYLVASSRAGYTNKLNENEMKEYFHNNYDKYSNWQIKKYADRLKDIVCLLIGCTREQLEDIDFKNKELGEEWWIYETIDTDGNDGKAYAYCDVKNVEELDSYIYIKLVKLTPRILLQNIGTNLFRNQLTSDIWVNALMSEYVSQGVLKNYVRPNWVITDVRFENEAKAIQDKKGMLIRVNRYTEIDRWKKIDIDGFHSYPKEHESETALDNFTFDYVIDNNSDINSLIEKVKEILIKEKII